MSKKYLILEYPHVSKMWCGGLGDRIVGLVSAILLARVSGRELQIKWDYPDMSRIWKIGIPFQPQILESKPSILVWNTIDRRHHFGQILSEKSLDEIWREDVVFLQCNQELASFVYENPCYPELKGLFEMHVTAAYQNVFAFYFVLQKGAYWKSGKTRVGVQLRTGDTSMNCGDHHIFSREVVVDKVLPLIRNFYQEHKFAVKTHEIFFTSDMNCIQQVREAWTPFPIVYQEGPITHLERQGDPEGLGKIVQDLAVLSQADVLIISWHSNLGRVAALMNPSTEVYALSPDLQLGRVTDKAVLTTKHHQHGNQLDAFSVSART
jgi:hypothetical protein